ncbi:unnamed protein product [Rodentolepis nana]|uniref:DUF5734 domain-containing protein n=1 Tax=Rodentolepis nana TaxID=102285 RepID=A0A0R3T9N3_RODNA|nr:unnamed protein product [Rodentolepis nana]
MTTIKPLPNSKAKNPLYYDEVVQMYDVVKVKAKANHNPVDALEELKNQLKKKKAIKATLLAGEEAIEFKKKGVGKSPQLKRLPYSAVKSFYQYTTSPAFVVMGVQANDIPKQYVILAAPTVEKANKLTEILQAGQLAPKHNLKNQVPPVASSDIIREEVTRSPSSPPARNSTYSPSPRRQTASRHTPSQSTHRQKSPSSHRRSARKTSSSTSSHSSMVRRPQRSSSSSSRSKTRSYSYPSYSERRRVASVYSSNARRSEGYVNNGSPSPPPQRYSKRAISVSTSTLIQIPISRNSSSPKPIPQKNRSTAMGYIDDKSFFIHYNPPRKMKKEKKSKSRQSVRSSNYYTSIDSSSSDSEMERKFFKDHSQPQPGIYLMADKKPKVKRVKNFKRSRSENTRLSSKIYYFSLNNTSSSSSTSSSDSEDETYIVRRNHKPNKSSSRRSKQSLITSWRSPPRSRYSSSSSSSPSRSPSPFRRRLSSSSSSSRSRSYRNKKKGKITNVPIVYCFPSSSRTN